MGYKTHLQRHIQRAIWYANGNDMVPYGVEREVFFTWSGDGASLEIRDLATQKILVQFKMDGSVREKPWEAGDNQDTIRPI